MKCNYKYQYDIHVKLECEGCDNSYIRHDIYETNNMITKKILEKMYENLYEGESDRKMPRCDKCNSFMFETEIVDLKETILPIKEVSNEF